MKHFDKFLPPEFAQKLRRIKQFQRTVEDSLPAEYGQWVKVGDIDNGCLTLIVSKQSVASNIRFHAASLQRALRQQHGIDIHRTRIRISQASESRPGQRMQRQQHQPPASEQERLDRERLRRVLKNLKEE